MSRHHFGRLGLASFLVVFCLFLAAPSSVSAYEYSYARVVRLSLVEGDVQISRPATANSDEPGGSGVWEQAIVNMPIQHGYSLATDNGRAEIEFESGATARLADNSVLQFTELALSDGGRITRLNLSQGIATFYANLSSQDVFEVSTPDVRVNIPKRASFRVDASSGLSTVEVFKGDVQVDTSAGTNRLTKGHSLSYRSAGNDLEIGRARDSDEWDRWVANREETIHTGSTAALQYVSSPYSYGLSDLHSYGNWYSVGGYGQCWRPRGVGFGWSPFSFGQWYFWPGLGWTWISAEPWGWLPYHYGSWLFSPPYGWVWVPGFHHPWRPALVNWVRIGPRTGWVPLHPNDRSGATPTNLQHGVITTSGGATGFRGDERRFEHIRVGREVEPVIVKEPPAGFVANRRIDPVRVGPGGPAGGIVTGHGNENGQGIVFDHHERKWVNNPTEPPRKNPINRGREVEIVVGPGETPHGSGGSAPTKLPAPAPPATKKSEIGPGGPERVPGATIGARPTAPLPPPPRVQSPPPPAPRVQSPPSAPPRMQSPPPAPPRPAPHSESSPRPSPPSAPAQHNAPPSSGGHRPGRERSQ